MIQKKRYKIHLCRNKDIDIAEKCNDHREHAQSCRQ